MNSDFILIAPSWSHWMGTDALGRDLLWRVLQGAQVSLGVAVLAVGLAVALGLVVGLVAGSYGGWVEKLLMGFTDAMLCFPTIFLILSVIAVLGPSLFNVMMIIGLTSWMGTARLVRAEVLSLKNRPFVLAVRAMGAPERHLILKHLLPNALGPVVVSAVLSFPSAILTESGLSFLGLGVQPPTPSWGNLLMDARSTLGSAWWMMFFPGLMIFLTVLCANLLGSKLRKKINP